MPNKDIAERLVRSPRIVQAHLTHAYAKLALGQPRFQVGNSTVLEPQVGPGSCETFVERAIVGAELAPRCLRVAFSVVIR